MSLQDKLKNYREEKLKAEKEAGTKFLAENKSKPGVTEIEGGIQYQVIRQGAGPRPGRESRITAHYRGSLLNGREFDSSYKRNQPFTASLKSLIKGWQQVIPLMPSGSIWRIWIPSELAYGDRGAGGDIPGGATLQFEIELIGVE